MEEIMKAMASVITEDVTLDFRPFLVIYKDGKIQRFLGTETVPPSKDAITGVESQDVVIRPEEEGGAWVRLYKPSPKSDGDGDERFPVLVYYHGGGFCVETAASPVYHTFLNVLCCKARMVIVSVDYRLAPEHPLPAAYDDSWAGLVWVKEAGHPWIKDHGDLSRVFLAGDSAGANIVHHTVKKLGVEKDKIGLNLKGMILIHSFFWGKERIGSEVEKLSLDPGTGMAGRLWEFVCPGTSGLDDPRIDPGMDKELGVLPVEKVLVCVAEQDLLRDRGEYYKEVLVKNGCKSVEFVETIGENHVFHLLNPSSPNVGPFMDKICGFLTSS